MEEENIFLKRQLIDMSMDFFLNSIISSTIKFKQIFHTKNLSISHWNETRF